MANSHTSDQREFIVRKLAAFEPPRAIALDFCAVFSDTKCDENDVKRLDPSVAVLPFELFNLFKQVREAVLLDPTAAPFANQQARMIALSNHAKFYNGNNQLPEMRAVLRQIAEEQGAIGGKAGKPGAAAPGDKPEPVTEIVRRVVDPKAPEPEPVV